MAIHLFLAGHEPQNTAAVSTIKHRTNWSKISLTWLEFESRKRNVFIQHIGNSEKEYYDIHTERYVDGYCAMTRTVFQFLGCYYHGCPVCFPDPTKMHPQKHVRFADLLKSTEGHLINLGANYQVVSIWECQWKAQYIPTEYDEELSNIILDRDELFYGGRTEVFSPYCQANDKEKLEYHDVCSLYPTVCSHDTLPIKFPVRYFGANARAQLQRLNPSHADPIFGYIRCRIQPNTKDCLGLLPARVDGKLVFDLTVKVGTWFSEEIYLAVSQGYVILDVYEILHWTTESRSNNYMKGYMSYFLRMKQESEGWKKAGASSETPSDDIKQQKIQELFELNGNMARMRSEYVEKNDVRRGTSKIYLNCLWGKLAQSSDQDTQKVIYGFHQFHKIHYDPEVQPESIRYRHIKGEAYEAIYKSKKPFYKRNAKYNIWIAAAVTAHARCRLHRQMIRVGPERILYCDTDSIVFIYPRDLPSLSSRGLGQWVDETKDMASSITIFCGFAPKTYLLVLDNNTYKIKAKGCRMTIPNVAKCTPDILIRILQNKCIETAEGYEHPEPLLLDHFSIFTNSLNTSFSYATVFSRYTTKKLRVVLSKRVLVPLLDYSAFLDDLTQAEFLDTHPLSLYGRIHTVPFGCDFNLDDYYNI